MIKKYTNNDTDNKLFILTCQIPFHSVYFTTVRLLGIDITLIHDIHRADVDYMCNYLNRPCKKNQ